MTYEEEELNCVHVYLDNLNIPRVDDKGEIYSPVGRIKRLEARFYKELDKLETHYLNK